MKNILERLLLHELNTSLHFNNLCSELLSRWRYGKGGGGVIPQIWYRLWHILNQIKMGVGRNCNHTKNVRKLSRFEKMMNALFHHVRGCFLLKIRIYQIYKKILQKIQKKKRFNCYIDEINLNRWILKELIYTLFWEHSLNC